MTTIAQLNDQLATINAKLHTIHKPVTIAPHVMDALTDPNHPHHPNRKEATMPTTMHDPLVSRPGYTGISLDEITDDMLDGEHDWDSYDSSDIHLRTQEWERQAHVIQHFVPTNRKLTITSTQRERANAEIAKVMPGVKLGMDLTQVKAHEVLASYVGVESANLIMAGE